MNTKRSSRFILLLLFCGLLYLLPPPAKMHAEGDFRVTEVSLMPEEADQTGRCPMRVNFHGFISANGPVTVRYTFTRSDGATAPVQTATFQHEGTIDIATDWTLGGISGPPRYEGWQAVKILSPNEMESSHQTGAFSVTCQDAAPPPPVERARFRVTINGFRVFNQTRDDLLERDGKGDEVFFVSQWQMTEDEREIHTSNLLQSRTMGDLNAGRDRVQAGSARGMRGGLQTNDTFPTSDPSALSGPPAGDRLPMLLLDEEMTSHQVLTITPTIWEEDGPDDELIRFGRFLDSIHFGGARTGLTMPVPGPPPAPEHPGLLGRILATETRGIGDNVHIRNSALGDPNSRPIGMISGPDNFIFFPQRLRFNFADAVAASQAEFGFGPGIIPISYTDDRSLEGNYMIFVQIARLGGTMVTPSLPPPPSCPVSLISTFIGDFDITADNRGAPITTHGRVRFTVKFTNCRIEVTDFTPMALDPYGLIIFPFGRRQNIITTVTRTTSGSGMGTLDPSNRNVEIPITLNFRHSLESEFGIFAGPSDMPLTLRTRSVTGGSMVLAGSGRFAGGFLNGTTGTVTITGDFSPRP